MINPTVYTYTTSVSLNIVRDGVLTYMCLNKGHNLIQSDTTPLFV